MLFKDIIALVYVLVLGIGVPRILVRKFPYIKKWKIITSTFLLMLLSSIPGAFIGVAYYNGFDYLSKISGDLVYLMAFSIGFSISASWPPFGLGWAGALISFIGFFIAYKKQKNLVTPSNSQNTDQEILLSESNESVNVIGDKKIQSIGNSATVDVLQKNIGLSKNRNNSVRTPVRRAILLLLIPITMLYVFSLCIAVHDSALKANYVVVNKETGVILETAFKEDHASCTCYTDKYYDHYCNYWSGIKKSKSCQTLWHQYAEKYSRSATPTDREWWLHFWDAFMNKRDEILDGIFDVHVTWKKHSFSIIPLIFLWMFVFGRLDFLNQIFKSLYVYTFKGMYNYIRYGQWIRK